MSAPKTSTPRVAKMRAGLKAQGLTRWELNPPPHPEDRAPIKEFAERLARRRARNEARKAKQEKA